MEVNPDPPIQFLNDNLFIKRLKALGYSFDPSFSFDWLSKPYVIPTVHKSSEKIKYDSDRRKAWRNLLVYAINIGIERKLFSLRPDDNRWSDNGKGHHVFRFELPNGLPVRVCLESCHWGELRIIADVNPKNEYNKYIAADYMPGFRNSDVHAKTWLKRDIGAWIEFTNDFNCRKTLMPYLAGLNVEPNGFGDRAEIKA